VVYNEGMARSFKSGDVIEIRLPRLFWIYNCESVSGCWDCPGIHKSCSWKATKGDILTVIDCRPSKRTEHLQVTFLHSGKLVYETVDFESDWSYGWEIMT
jgi:hypothetical protein